MSRIKVPRVDAPPQQHDTEDPATCSHCGAALRSLEELARLLRLSMRHDGHLLDKHTGRCNAVQCWCKVVSA